MGRGSVALPAPLLELGIAKASELVVGANLAAALAQLARDRGRPTSRAQLLADPAVDQDTTRTCRTRWGPHLSHVLRVCGGAR